MAKKRESRRQKRIHKLIKKNFNWFGFKTHGGPFQKSGLPDLLGCIAGLFFGFEVKEPDGTVSGVQKEVMRDIRKAGGHVKVIVEPKEAVKFIRGVLAQEGKLLEGIKATPKARRKNRGKSVIYSLALQTTLRKNLHRLRGD